MARMELFGALNSASQHTPIAVTDEYVYAEVWLAFPFGRTVIMRADRNGFPRDALTKIEDDIRARGGPAISDLNYGRTEDTE